MEKKHIYINYFLDKLSKALYLVIKIKTKTANEARMNKKLNIKGEIINAKLFKKRQSAENYIAKHGGKIVFFRAGEYYVA